MTTSSLSKLLIMLAGLVHLCPAAHAGDDHGIPAVSQVGDDPNIGIKYKSNLGLFVTDISAKIIGLKMADVEEKPVPKELRLVAQIYDTSPAGKALASAWIPAAEAADIKAEAIVDGPESHGGIVKEVSTLTATINQKAEVLMELNDAGDTLKIGQFLNVTATLPAKGDVVVVPKSAVLQTSEGTFAYVDNSGWKARTAIKTGAEHEGLVEVTDGLLSGDAVVTNPVMTLWMTELQMTKSGKA
jgi:hypothetical protein